MYNVPADVTMLQLNMASWVKTKYADRMEKTTMLPRLLWVKRDMTLKELHMTVFKTLRQVFSEWASWADPDCTRELKTG